MESEKERMERKESFTKVIEPVIKWMCENTHPHSTIIIDHTHAELLEGAIVHSTEKFLVD